VVAEVMASPAAALQALYDHAHGSYSQARRAAGAARGAPCPAYPTSVAPRRPLRRRRVVVVHCRDGARRPAVPSPQTRTTGGCVSLWSLAVQRQRVPSLPRLLMRPKFCASRQGNMLPTGKIHTCPCAGAGRRGQAAGAPDGRAGGRAGGRACGCRAWRGAGARQRWRSCGGGPCGYACVTVLSLWVDNEQPLRACSRCRSVRRCCTPALQRLPSTTHKPTRIECHTRHAVVRLPRARLPLCPGRAAAPLPDIASTLLRFLVSGIRINAAPLGQCLLLLCLHGSSRTTLHQEVVAARGQHMQLLLLL